MDSIWGKILFHTTLCLNVCMFFLCLHQSHISFKWLVFGLFPWKVLQKILYFFIYRKIWSRKNISKTSFFLCSLNYVLFEQSSVWTELWNILLKLKAFYQCTINPRFQMFRGIWLKLEGIFKKSLIWGHNMLFTYFFHLKKPKKQNRKKQIFFFYSVHIET